MQRIRDSIENNSFPSFVRSYVRNYYSKNKTLNKEPVEKAKENVNENNNIPEWVINSLKAVNIDLFEN